MPNKNQCDSTKSMADIFTDAAIKKEKLEQEFATLPDTIIYGVVGANGPSAGNSPPHQEWSLIFSLIAWKEAGGKINPSRLIVSKQLANGELQAIQDSVKKESLVQLKVKLSRVSPFGDARAQLISILNPPDDTELKAVLEQYKSPVEITHPKFGLLTFNRSLNWFEGSINWMGQPVRVSISVDEENASIASSIKTLEALYRHTSDWSKKITDYAVAELLDLKNESWRTEDQEEVTASAFAQAMQLESITVDSDGEFEFWHHDGDLFWGHSILITGSLTEGPLDADIPG